MKMTIKALAAIAFLALGSGAAYAADQAMKMDCCKDCCKDKAARQAAPADHQQHQK